MGGKESSHPQQRPPQDPSVMRAVYSNSPAPFGPNTEADSFGTVRPSSAAQTAVAIRPDALILKDTLALTELAPRTLSLSFHFIAKVPCSIAVYQFAEELEPGIRFWVDEKKYQKPMIYNFAPTEKSQFPPQLIVIDTARSPPNLLEFRDLKTYPLILECRPQYQDPRPPQVHTTYVMYRREGGRWRPIVVKQIFILGGMPHILQDIYGLQNADTSEMGNECVICLTERKHVAVMPCRHVCLCSDCSTRMNRSGKCPICRGPIESFMTLSVQGR